MIFFTDIPTIEPIGYDLYQLLSYVNSWIIQGGSPYIGNNLYPPLTLWVFSPFAYLPYQLAYLILTLLTIFCFIGTIAIFPVMAFPKKYWLLLILILVTSLNSYGFLFELERGQFNIIAIFLCFIAIWIFHNYPNKRIFAYVIFIICVQFKIFPFIFIVFFVDNWLEWRTNITRFVILSFFTLATTVIFGIKVFTEFINALYKQIESPFLWEGNHSIRAFSIQLAQDLSQYFGGSFNNFSKILQLSLISLVGICLLVLLFFMVRENKKGVNPPLLLGCTLAALVIPSVSHDYTLPIIAGPIVLYFIWLENELFRRDHTNKILLSIFTLILSLAYFSLNYSYTNKPLLLQNNLPVLILMLITTTAIAYLDHKSSISKNNNSLTGKTT